MSFGSKASDPGVNIAAHDYSHHPVRSFLLFLQQTSVVLPLTEHFTPPAPAGLHWTPLESLCVIE